MIIDAVRMPVDVERGVRGGPQFSTIVNRTDGGALVTNQNWSYPLYRGQVGYGIQSKENLRDVIKFFYARRGRLRGFLFRDWSDYQFDGERMDGWAKSCGYMVEVPPGAHAGPEWDCDACEGGAFSCWELRLPEAPPPESEKKGGGK